VYEVRWSVGHIQPPFPHDATSSTLTSARPISILPEELQINLRSTPALTELYSQSCIGPLTSHRRLESQFEGFELGLVLIG